MMCIGNRHSWIVLLPAATLFSTHRGLAAQTEFKQRQDLLETAPSSTDKKIFLGFFLRARASVEGNSGPIGNSRTISITWMIVRPRNSASF
jgi:hypothetical protein